MSNTKKTVAEFKFNREFHYKVAHVSYQKITYGAQQGTIGRELIQWLVEFAASWLWAF